MRSYIGRPEKPLTAAAAPIHPDMDELVRRVDRMEGLLDEMKPLLARLDERLNHLATKADLSTIKGELLEKIAEKPGKAYLWTVLAVLVGAVLAATAAGAGIVAALK